MQVTVNNITTQVEVQAGYELYEIHVEDYSAESAKNSAIAAALSASNALNSANDAADSAAAALASENAAAADALATAADRVQTGLDRVATGQDRTATGADALATAADRVQTGLDRIATGADRVQTGTDAGVATTQAGIATTQAGIATTQASNALSSANAASASASNALNSANAASVSATNALNSANAASASATNAMNSANAAAASASAAAQVGTSTLLTGFSVGANTAIAATDSILQAFNKTQGQINARVTSNIYSANGSLVSERAITLAGFPLDFVGTTTSRFFANGNFAIGTTTDAGFRLDVNGTARVQGGLNVSTGGITLTGAQTIQSSTGNLTLATAGGNGNILLSPNGSGRVLIGTGSLLNKLQISSADATSTVASWDTRSSFAFARILGDSINGNLINYGTGTPLRFASSSLNFDNFIEVARFSSGNFLIGTNTDAGFRLDVNGTARVQGALTVTSNLIIPTVTGTRIGTATNQLLSFWNKTPIAQPTTGIAAATLAGSGGSTITSGNTFGGYTIQQIAQALINIGILA